MKSKFAYAYSKPNMRTEEMGRGRYHAGAVAHCRRVIAEHSKSFALASRVLPPLCRDRAAVVYTWCRRVDDAVDLAEPGHEGRALDRARAELAGVYARRPQSDMALEAFAQVVEDCGVPQNYPQKLLDGMAMDVASVRYRSMDTLLEYCYCVAGTVGLMMSHVMGICRDSALVQAAHLGMAMQLTNICRDVLEDWNRGRLYVPDEILAEHGLDDLPDALGGAFPDAARPGMAAAVQRLLALADRYYRSGDQGLDALPWRSAFAVRAARLVYSAIGARIARAGHDVKAGRAVVPGPDKLCLVGRAGVIAMTELPRRFGHRQGRACYRIPMNIIEEPAHVIRI